jgi:fibronectin type 3 domain-containing protein
MPQAIPALITSFVTAAKAITLASVIKFAAITAASMAASKLLAPKMPSFADSSLSDRSQLTRNPISARTIVYGKSRVSGTIVYLSTTGDKNQFLHIVLTLAGHEIQAIDEVYFNDELVPLSGNTPTGFYNGVARVKKHLGEANQTVDTDLRDETSTLTDGKWTDNHRLRGIAYLYVRLTWDAEKYPSGIPNISAVIRGKKVLDPRTGNTAYSANAALCLRDYLTDAALGMGMSSAEVDDTAFGVAATICEEQVQILPESPVAYENRYEANGVIVTSASPDENIGKLLSAMGGLIAYTGGRIVPYASAYRIPTVTLTEKHFVGPLNVQTRTSARDRVNSVKGVYVSETNNWQVTDFPTISSPTYVTADNSTVFFRDVVLPFTTSPSCAQRLAVLELRRAREEITFSARFRLEAMQVRAGDTVMITNEKLGWSSKVFEVMEWNFASDGTPPQVFIDMTLRETASSVYSWTVTDEIFVEDSPNTTLPDPFTLGAPTNLSLTADGTTQLVQADGTILPRIRIGWTPPAAEFIQSGGSVVIEYKPSASTTYLTWNTVEGAQTEDFISSDITIGTNYNVRIYGESFFGISTTYLAGSITVAKDTTAPAIPTGLSAAIGTGKAVSLDWNDNTEPDFSEYGIYRNVSAVTPANANTDKIAEVRASRFVDTDVAIGTTYYYWLNAYDTVENVSGFTSYVQATPSVITAGPIDPSAPDQPNAPTFISTTVYESSDGGQFAQVSLTAPPLPTKAVALDILYRRTGASDFLIGNQIASAVSYPVSIDDLTVGVAYEFAARGISFSGALSPVSSVLSRTAGSKTTPPAVPTSLTAIAGTGQIISLDWADNTENDLFEYGVYRNTSNNPGAAGEIAQVMASRFVDVSLSLNQQYFYWVTAYDRSENQSAKSATASATAVAVVAGQTDPTPPVDPAAPTVASTTTYLSSDGTTFAQIVVSVPAFTTRTAVMNVLYRKAGQSGFIVADQRSSGGGESSIDDLTPAVSYEIGVQAFSAFGIGSAVVTGPTQLAPSKTTGPAAPSGVVYTTGNNANFGRAAPLGAGSRFLACRVNWTAPADKDISYYQYALSSADTDASADAATKFDVVETEAVVFSQSILALFFRVRAVNRSGVVGAWGGGGVSFSASALWTYPSGSMIEQDATAVNISGGTVAGITDIAIADGGTGASTASSARANLGINRFSHVQTLTGGAPTETFTFTHNLGVTQDYVLAACVDPANDVLIAHDYAAAGNNSNDTVFQVATADGSNISAGNRRFTIHFVQ